MLFVGLILQNKSEFNEIFFTENNDKTQFYWPFNKISQKSQKITSLIVSFGLFGLILENLELFSRNFGLRN